MARLRRVDCSGPGIRRRRRGKGFEYLDDDGKRVTRAERARARSASSRSRPPGRTSGSARIRWATSRPPARTPPGASSTATTTTGASGATREKFEAMIDFARALPAHARARREGPRGARACRARRCSPARCGCSTAASSASAREDYAEENDTYGIATMGKRHVTVSGDRVTFDYEAKGGKRRVQSIGDPEVARSCAR